MVMRLDHKGAKFPPPSEGLYEGMARVAHKEFCEVWLDVGKDKGKRVPWESLCEDRKLAWESSMREVWKFMAIKGGAKKRRTGPPRTT